MDNAQSTSVVHGKEATTSIRLQTLGRAERSIDICDDSLGIVALVRNEKILGALIDTKTRPNPPRIRFITEISAENIPACSQLLKYVELRHFEGLRGNFAVTDKEYYAFSELKDATLPNEAIHSNVGPIVEQNRFFFETLWNKALPADIRIAELEQGIVPVETKVVRGTKQATEVVDRMLERVASSGGSSYLFVASRRNPQSFNEKSLSLTKKLLQQNPKLKIKSVTDIRSEDIEGVGKLLQLGVEVRHIANNKITFLVSSTEYFSLSDVSIRSDRTPESDDVEAIWSNSPEVVSQATQIFNMLWESAVLGQARISEIKEGFELGETRIIRDMAESARIAREIFGSTEKEVLIILASEKTIKRNLQMYQDLVKESVKRGFKIKILASIQTAEEAKILEGVDWRRIEPINVGFAIYDRKKMLVTQYLNSSDDRESPPLISNIYTTNKQTIEGIVSIFNALWRESELRTDEENAREELASSLLKEERSRKQAQLLQDILTHDIRNFNQVSMLSAELLKDVVTGNPQAERLADGILQATDGSSTLVEKGKKLGMILSEENPRLHAVDVISSISSSLQLVKRAFPEKVVIEEIRAAKDLGHGDLQVLADDLLDEVFSNLFSNSIKYTEASKVPILVEVEREGTDLKISVSDEGSGVPENLKTRMFDRYLVGAKGTGLGMSIIHALVVNRYNGKIDVSNRADRPSGTRIRVWLPMFNPSAEIVSRSRSVGTEKTAKDLGEIV
jgi:two-component system, OmpR family, sensor histidine kinase VicK